MLLLSSQQKDIVNHFSKKLLLVTSEISHTYTHAPVFQVRHGEVSADEAHFEWDDLPVTTYTALGRLVAAAEVWGLKTPIPRQIRTHRGLLKERRHLPDVLHCTQHIQPNSAFNIRNIQKKKAFTHEDQCVCVIDQKRQRLGALGPVKCFDDVSQDWNA